MLTNIWSGGQTGADEGGLRAAKLEGLAVGGWMPAGFLRLTGPDPEFASLYGMREHPSPTYPPRTFANVRDTQATIQFATSWSSRGELCTAKAIRQYDKPSFQLDFNLELPPQLEALLAWLKGGDFSHVNVAGNSERTSPGICLATTGFMVEVIRRQRRGE